MLTVSPLTLGYGGNAVARFAGMQLGEGEHCLLIGASGCGKTTLLHTLAGLLRPIAGTVAIGGTDISSLPEAARDRFRGRHIGLIFQTLHLMPALNVMENLRLAFYAAGISAPLSCPEDALKALGLWQFRHSLPHALSQGQQQRVAIARAVMNAPGLILADEPTSSLDDAACRTVIELILSAAEKTRAALVISTHDQRLKPYFPRIVEMEAAP